jgi:hypothetical protein
MARERKRLHVRKILAKSEGFVTNSNTDNHSSFGKVLIKDSISSAVKMVSVWYKDKIEAEPQAKIVDNKM